MLNISCLKAGKSKGDSPKTPGGISKAFLTPCRRLGLSRKWRNSGSFTSPLNSNNSGPVTNFVDKKASTKRKIQVSEEEDENGDILATNEDRLDEVELNLSKEKTENINATPIRAISLSRRKKSKTFLAEINIPETNSTLESTKVICTSSPKGLLQTNSDILQCTDINKQECTTVSAITEPRKLKSVNSNEIIMSTKDHLKKNTVEITKLDRKTSIKKKGKDKSLDNLTTKCLVVIEKNILNNKTNSENELLTNSQVINLASQNSDDAPLSCISNTNKEVTENTVKTPTTINLDEDYSDFTEISINKPLKVKKLQDKKTSTGDLSKTVPKPRKSTTKTKPKLAEKEKQSSQTNIFLDDDDFVLDMKRTILISKSYHKTAKPTKAKSTGSITQRDIDELKARIEIKRGLLLTKAMTKDNEELIDSIKKWKKGCLDALEVLMDLMRKKFPENHNMDFSELLEMLKIPSSLVGYEEDHDSFVSPNDIGLFPC